MANTNAPNGFVDWTGTIGGSASNFGLITRIVDKDDTTAIFSGDPVKNLDTGYVAQWTASTAVSQLAGIFRGCSYLSTALGRTVWSNFWPGSGAAADVTAYLTPCNLAVPPTFVVQALLTPFTFVDIGAVADVDLGTGSTVTGLSAATLSRATIGTTATLPFRVVGLLSAYSPPGANGVDNTASYNRVIVAANVSGAGSTGLN